MIISKAYDKISINLEDEIKAIDENAPIKIARTDYTPVLWEFISASKWSIVRDQNTGKMKYLKSSKYQKTLHQLVMDVYFGEDFRKQAYEQGMILEHLDNDGFNCEISNLFFLLKVKNTYKGWYLDKLVEESMPRVALAIFHIIANRTFQLTLAFNQTFTNCATGKRLSNIKLLYSYDYEIVLQDSEQILQSILSQQHISIQELRERYRFIDCKVEEMEELILTEEEKLFGTSPGRIFFRNNMPYMDVSKVMIQKAGPEISWTK